MSKKDPVFWWATGIFVLALLLFYITQAQEWLFLGVVSYLLRPTLASLGIARRHIDERQMTINYRSGNIAFAVTLLACVIVAVKLAAEGDHAFEYFHMIVVIGLATKAVFNVILIRNFREAAAKILIATGLLMALFMSFSSFHPWSPVSFVMNTLPGLTVAGIGLLSRKYPRFAGALVLIATAFLLWKIFNAPRFNWGSIAAAIIIGVPLTIGGIYLLRCEAIDTDAELDGELL